ncbi:MAG TPA: hypothetical protein VII06_06175 [Chloroflexota bacterium]
MARDEVVALYEGYAASFSAPIRSASAVTALRQKDCAPGSHPHGSGWRP